jgi:hypothetical protein
MTTIKKLGLLSVVAGALILVNTSTVETYAAPPASYDYRIAYYYDASNGSSQLWGYTPSGGGITELIYFYQEETYWRSISSSFYNSEFTFQIRIPRSTLNDAMFSPHPSIASAYMYNSPDGNLSYYYVDNTTSYVARFYMTVNDADYFVHYMRNIVNTNFRGTRGYNVVFYSGSGTSAPIVEVPTNTQYTYPATYSMPSNLLFYPVATAETLIDNVQSMYIRLTAAAKIEAEDYWDIYNTGVQDGFDAGEAYWYELGLQAGILEGSSFMGDIFAVFRGAISVVGDLLAISLFGGLTIGALVSVPIVIGLLFWIIEKWRGS